MKNSVIKSFFWEEKKLIIIIEADHSKSHSITLKGIDISNPTDPKIFTINILDNGISRYAFFDKKNERIFFYTKTDADSKINIFDISNIKEIKKISSIKLPKNHNIHNIFQIENTLYLSVSSYENGIKTGILVFDINNLDNPRMTSYFPTTNTIYKISYKDNKLYLFYNSIYYDYNYKPGIGIEVFEANNLFEPIFLEDFPLNNKNLSDIYMKYTYIKGDKVHIFSRIDKYDILETILDISTDRIKIADRKKYIIDLTLAKLYNLEFYILDFFGIERYWESFCFLSSDKRKLYIIHKNKLKIFDISDTYNPIITKFLNTKEIYKMQLDRKNKKLFIATVKELLTIDINDPLFPIKTYFAPVSGNFVFSKDKRFLYTTSSTGFDIYDITDIDNPKKLSHTNIDFIFTPIEILDENKIAFANYREVQIWDISDPFNPIKISSDDAFGADTVGFRYLKEKSAIFISSKGAGLGILDVSDFYNPKIIYRSNDLFSGALCLSKDKTKLFLQSMDPITEESYIKIINITNLTKPKTISKMNIEIYDPFTAFNQLKYNFISLSKNEKKAFLATYRNNIPVFDISDIKNPKHLYTIHLENRVKGVVLSDDETKLFVNIKNKGIKILDLTLNKKL